MSVDEYAAGLADFAGLTDPRSSATDAATLARFRRYSLLRIVLRDVLGAATLSDVTEELSNLSDAILDAALRGVWAEFAERHGVPRYRDASGQLRECRFTVISLGKLGGKELNYSSDIDLMFLYEANGQTDGLQPIANKEFYKKVANRYTELLSTYTADGLCYRVDLRLRPDGRLGEVCISAEGARLYYAKRARDWELQMLIKARVSAGDIPLGRALLEYVEPMIYQSTLDFRAVENLSETRQRISEKLAAKHARSASAALDVKLSPGGIRDIEFMVQCLQRLHGGREPWVRHGGTLFALFRLHDKGLLSGSEYSRLASAYQFLRNLEHRLQFQDDRQTHSLPSDPAEFGSLARKMPHGPAGPILDAAKLRTELDHQLAEVRELYDRVIHSQKPLHYKPLSYAPPEPGHEAEEAPEPLPSSPSNLTRFLDQRAPELAVAIARSKLNRGRVRFEHFLDRVFQEPPVLEKLVRNPDLADCAIDLFEHSQYFSDQLIRNPELVGDLCPSPRPAPPLPPDDAGELRRFFHRGMLRIQSESVFCRVPIFTTLEQTSDLADTVIAAAYRMALAQRLDSRPPEGYDPARKMMVIALGRLGMREFDLASDADLLFVIPDTEAPRQLFWTGVAESMIEVMTSYTGDGVIFAVDTRLRPNGREGALVQTEAAYKDYFAVHAEAWEGISYMKARGVADDVDAATRFLNELQEVDWRRYGQAGGRSRKELAQMRVRLEKEQGPRNPLKAGRGGYYDIDFALMYLRLKGAGIFFKVLNTPQRIDIIEKMGHLEREDADFLRDAAAFYRAVDHGLRISSGHAEGKLPSAQSQLAVLTELVHRWTPEHMQNERLSVKLSQIRQQTREFFDRIFRVE
jgi:[glutamine synthetase] adenylyltransferase / [glutamine synthetase]-adenylyl-L-tyrosine phosphorylase